MLVKDIINTYNEAAWGKLQKSGKVPTALGILLAGANFAADMSGSDPTVSERERAARLAANTKVRDTFRDVLRGGVPFRQDLGIAALGRYFIVAGAGEHRLSLVLAMLHEANEGLVGIHANGVIERRTVDLFAKYDPELWLPLGGLSVVCGGVHLPTQERLDDFQELLGDVQRLGAGMGRHAAITS